MTRIAPTPSGYLHPGNAVNFLLTAWLAQQEGGRLLLRIDDMDADRVRLPYLQDVFRVVAWLGLRIDGGPGDVAQFQREFSQACRTDYYRGAVDLLRAAGAQMFACTCSRRDFTGRYPGTCRTAGHRWVPGDTTLRLLVPQPCRIDVGGAVVDVAQELGDFVLWRRNDTPSYQLASVIEDRDLGVNAIVRGADLMPSTAAQLLLAPMLGAHRFAAGDFRHHELVVGPDGAKLSKSAGRQAASMVGDDVLRAQIVALTRALAPSLGIQPRE